jgi:succinate dehydrogenase/fumarate reductase flavoprotein subunit
MFFIGGGAAGLRAAIQAREKGVEATVASKSRMGHGNNTYLSKGSFSAATRWRDQHDNPDAHMRIG